MNHRSCQRVSAIVVSALLLPTPALSIANAPTQPLNPADSAYAELATKAAASVDQSRVDIDALLMALDYDDSKIVDYVTSTIRFEQYPGLLRGARGTLLGGAGNALDQAVLLATLLNDAGVDARIVRGELTDSDAALLVRHMRSSARRSRGDADNHQRLSAWFDRTDHPEVTEDIEPQSADGEARRLIQEMSKRIHGQTKRKLELPNRGEIITEARDYYWVEQRTGAAADWQAVHPAFPSGVTPTARPSAYLADSVPDELQHKLRIRVFLERAEGQALSVEQITPDWTRPVANLSGRSVSVVNMPLDLNLSNAADVSTQIAEKLTRVKLFATQINGETLPGSQGFDTDGTLFDPEVLSMDSAGMAPVFRTIGSKTDSAAAALSGLGSKVQRTKMRHLTAQWIEYTLIAPGGAETSYQRFLIDRIGPSQRATGKLSPDQPPPLEPIRLIASEHVLAAGGQLPADLLLQDFVESMQSRHRLARALAADGTVSAQRLQQLIGDANPTRFRLLSLIRRFDVQSSALATYRSAPTLLAMHSSFPSGSRFKVSTDIMHNPRRTHQTGSKQSTQRTLLQQGVWETYAERYALAHLRHGLGHLGTPFGATPTTAFDSGTNTRLRVMKPEARFQRNSAWTPGIQTRMHHDLAQNIVLTASPAARGGGSVEPAWWRVDPRTGATIGVMADGRGATVAEWIVIATIGALVLAALHKITGFGHCLMVKFDESYQCLVRLNEENSEGETGFFSCIGDYMTGDLVLDPQCK